MSATDERCAYCEGTGKVWLMKSWSWPDGYRTERCGTCHGSGRSNYQPPADHVRQMRAIRRMAEAQAVAKREEGV